MIEITSNLFIGTEYDYESAVKHQSGWYIVHACKEPYHRQLLGYSGRGAPKNHPEYLLARRGTRLFLNLVDVEDPSYISKEIIDAALSFIDEAVTVGAKCLVHCNQGESRSPSIGLLYLASKRTIHNVTLLEAEEDYRKIYPSYNPKAGMRGFMRSHWSEYTK
jgi:predicted protein tyrosine phosphatase